MHSRRRRAQIESFEPRILYSADPGPAGLASALLTAADLQADGGGALQGAGTELVFIDARVPEVQVLLDDLAAQQRAGRPLEVVVIDARADGIAVIGESLAGRSDVTAIHLIGHGAAGVAELGASRLDADALVQRAGEIAAWGDALTSDADLLIYGCDVASTAAGEGLVDGLAALTGADVAASDDPTGAAGLGGDWDLEYRSGVIDTALAPSVAAQQAWDGVLAITANGSPSSTNSTSTNSLSWSHTVADGSNRALFVEVSIANTGTTATSVTYGGTALTLVGRSTTGNLPVEIWQLVNPTVGTANVVVNLSATTPVAAGATSFNGVSQANPVRTFYSASGTGTESSVTVADSATGDLVIDVQAWQGQPTGGTVGPGQSLNWSSVNTFITGGSTQEAGAPSVVMSASFTSSAQWVIGAVAIRPSASAPGITVSPISGLTVTEAGGTAQFGVVLDAAPTANVTIGLSSSDTTEGTLSTSSLTFTPANWNVAQTVTVTGVDDGFIDGNVAFSVVTAAATSTDANYNGLNASDVSVTNIDDDTFNTIVVDTAADTADGTTTSIAALMANKGADGKISLREAITAANNTANGPGGADRISFAIGSGSQTLSLGSALPVITGALVIDGRTQTGYAGTPLIVIDADGLAATGIQLGSGADGSTVRGLVLRDFTGAAIQIDAGSDGNTIAGNYIGSFGAAGVDLGSTETNLGAGISVGGANNTIGGLTAADRNVIGGNAEGVIVTGAAATNNVIAGNYIGTDASGAVAVANTGHGIDINGGASGTIVGGSASGAGNVISGNARSGVAISAVSNTTVQGNTIGLNAAGTAALANGEPGVNVRGASTTLIGGDTALKRNIISGNTQQGIVIGGASTGTTVSGNWIGVGADGTTAFGNAAQAIYVAASDVLIGGTSAAQANIIANSTGFYQGIAVDSGYTSVRILGNSVYGNATTGIDLVVSGETNLVTANDAGDADTGANNLQNFPVLTTATTDGSSQLHVKGSLNSTAGSYYRIEFFANTSQDASGYGEGQTWLGFANVATDASGNASIDVILSAAVPVGRYISATATRSDSSYSTFTDTSEFSRNVAAVSGTQASITVDTASDTSDGDTTSLSTLLANKGADGLVSLREAILAANNTANGSGGADRILFSIAGSGPHSIALASVLPAITEAVIIDGTSEPDFAGTPVIELDGAAAGTVADTTHGLVLGSGSSGSVIKGLAINRFAGSAIQVDSGSGNHLIAGNYLGTDTSGRVDLGNGKWGIDFLFSGGSNVVGGTTAALRNLIVGNDMGGIALNGGAVTGNVVLGNYIGVGSDGTTALGNGPYGGIVFFNGATARIGGVEAGEGNLIAYNSAAGITVTDGTAAILGNRIFGNGALGIDLGPAGVTANDSGDADTGPNALQNFPVIGSVLSVGGNTTVTGTLNSNPSTTYRLEFFSSPTGDASGHGEGQTWLGATEVTTDASGNASFSATFSGVAVPGGEAVSATATVDLGGGSYGATSEFAANVIANNAPTLDAGKSPALDPVAEDAGAPSGAVGTLVSSDFASPAGQVDNVSDPDAGALTGIAVTGANTSSGSWWYSINNGGAWQALGSVSDASARLLSADAATRLYFQPTANWNGSLADAITFRAWDRTSGANGELADTTANGGSTAFSATRDTASLTVNAVNDAPVVVTTATPLAYGENASAVVDGAITVTDVDGGNLAGATVSISGGFRSGQDSLLFTNQGGIRGNWNGQTGVLTLSGSASIAAYQAALRSVVYANASDNPATATRTVSFAVTDGAAASNTATRDITVAAVNDGPSFDAADFVLAPSLFAGGGVGYATVVQPDGKIVVAGYAGSTPVFALARYNVDGTLDTSFGGGSGVVTTAIGGSEDKAYALALQADGKILVAGSTLVGAQFDFALVRYNGDGSLDTSFGGGDGIVTTDFAPSSADVATGVVVQADGRIVVGGTAGQDFAVARYLADGSLDTAFSGDGRQTVDLAGGADEALALALQADGRIVQVGSATAGAGPTLDFGVVRYNTDGSLDIGFSGDGKLTTAIGSGWDIAHAVAVQPDGGIVVAGYSGANQVPNDVALVRYLADGTLDAGFGNGGVVTTDVSGSDAARAVAVQDDGRIVVAGGTASFDSVVIRYLANGSLDTSFSGDGKAVVDTAPQEMLFAVDLAPDGRIVAAGHSGNGTPNILILRLATDGSLDTRANPSVSSLGASASYTENGSPVVIDGSVRIFDAELSSADSFDGATLTLARSGGASSQDLFSGSGNLGALVTGEGLVFGGVTVGSVVGNGGGTLSLSFNANATQARINEVMSAIAYANASDTPPASVQLAWTFSDGNVGGQGSGGALTATGSSTVVITAVNDAPVITFVSGSANYPENAGPVVVAPSATVSDADSTDFDGGRLVVYFSANGQPEDRVGIRNQGTGAGQIGVSGSNVTYGGMVIGSWSGGTDGATPLVVSFNANATPAAAQALGRNITYQNVSDNPSTLVRTMVGYLEDGDGGTSNTVGGTLTIIPSNDAPVATDDAASVVEDQPYTSTTSLLANDSDVDGPPLSVVAGTYGTAQGGSIVITADGHYTYTPAANFNGTDTVDYTLTDGSLTDVGRLTLTVTAVNDPAVIGGSDTADLTETDAAQSTSGTLTVSDVDSPATFVVQSGVAGSNGYGTFSLDAGGAWTYTMSSAHDEFVAGTTYTDSFTATTADGTSRLVTVTITGSNDAAQIGGTDTADLTETDAAQSTGGTLTVSDVDSPAAFVVRNAVAGSNGYGTFSLDAGGAWTYTMSSAHDAFVAGSTYTDSFTASTADGTTRRVTVTITGSNDAAQIGGTDTADLTETDAAQSTGDTLTVSDVDSPAAFVARSAVAGSNGYGTFSLDAGGAWTYTMSSAHDAFVAGSTYTDSFTATTADGTSRLVTVTITGSNDAAQIGGTDTADLTETDAAQSTGGTLTVSDVDSPATFVVQSGVAGSNGYGTFSLDAGGAWTYTMSSAHDAFVAGTTYTDSFTATTADGTSRLVTVTITGSNDAAQIGGTDTADLTETDAAQSTGGTLTVSDVDSPATFVVQSAVAGSNGYGTFSLDAGGAWTYTMSSAHDEFVAGSTYTDSFTASTADGTTRRVTVTITGSNDAAQIGGTDTADLTETDAAQSTGGTLTVSDVDSPAAFVVRNAVAGSNGYGTFSLDAGGAWTYTMSSAHDAFVAGSTYTDSFTASTADGTTRRVTVTITGSNDAAQIGGTDTADLTETDAAQSTGGTLTVSDVDSPATFVVQNAVAGSNGYGTFSLDAGGAWTYTMSSAHDEFVAGTTYTDSFTATTADGTSRLVTVTITGSNDAAQIGGTDTADLTETDAAQSTGGTLTVSDVDSPATFVVQSGVAGSNGYGTFSLDAGGGWSYTMSGAHDEFVAGSTYTDSFTATTADGTSRLVTVTITGSNDAAQIGGTDTADLTETDAAQSTGGTLTVSDVDSPATFVVQSAVAGSNGYGTFSLDAGGAWTYTMSSAHDEFVAGSTYTDSFTASTADGTSRRVTVTITGSNDAAQIGGSDTADLTETDAAQSTGGTLTVSDVDSPAAFVARNAVAGSNGYGTFSLDAGGAWTYTMSGAHDEFVAGSTYTDSFTASTADGTTRRVTVTITGSNDIASLGSDAGFITETDLSQAIGGSLTLTDPDAVAASVVAQSDTLGTYGHFSIDASGTWTYATAGALDALAAGQVVSDVFNVATTDGGSATVTITLTGSNDAPTVASPIAGQRATQDSAFRFTLPAGSFADVDTGDSLGYSATGLPAWLSFDAATRTFSGTPANADVGRVSITVTATDASSAQASTRFDLTVANVNDDPVALADSVSTAEDTPLTFDPTANDSDVDGDVLIVAAVTQGAHGRVSVVDGAIRYMPDADFHGADSFSYVVSDGQGGSATARVSVTVTPVDDLPQAADDAWTTREDEALTGSVADNDSPSGDGGNRWTLVTGPSHGSLVLAGDGSFRYTPDPDFHGSDSFSYALADADGDRATARVAIEVTPVNDAPVLAGGDALAVDVAENTTAVTTLAATDVDRPAQALQYSIVGGADRALFAVDAASGVLRFIAPPDFDAPADANADNVYELIVQVSDGFATASQTLAVTVANRNEMPAGSDGRIDMAEDGSHVFTLADFGFRDVLDSAPNQLAAVQIVVLPGQAALQLAGRAVEAGEWVAAGDIAAGRLTYQPAPDANGHDYATLLFRVRDDGGTADGGVDTEAASHTLHIDVAAVNDAPVITRVAFELPAGSRIVLGADAIVAADVDSALASLGYIVDTATGGHFELLGAPGEAIAAFSQAELSAGRVVFVHDGAAAPLVVIRASDGQADSGAVRAAISLQVSAPGASTSPTANPQQPPVTTVTPAAPKPAEADKATKMPAFLPSRPGVLEGLAPAPNPASAGDGVVRLGRDGAGNADPASRVRNQILGGPPRLERAPVQLSLGGGVEGPLMDFLLRGDGLVAATGSAGSALRMGDGGQRDALQERDGEVDVRVVLQAIELTGVALSVGAVWWATRAGALVASLLVSVPAWRNFDPLMVLGPEDENDRDWAGVMDDQAVQDEMGIAEVFDAGMEVRP